MHMSTKIFYHGSSMLELRRDDLQLFLIHYSFFVSILHCYIWAILNLKSTPKMTPNLTPNSTPKLTPNSSPKKDSRLHSMFYNMPFLYHLYLKHMFRFYVLYRHSSLFYCNKTYYFLSM